MRYPDNGSAVLLVLLSLAQGGAAAVPSSTYDPSRPRWTALEFTTSKFLMSADAQVSARMRPAGEVTPKLLTTPTGAPVAPGTEVLQMTYKAAGLGRDSLTTLYADPVTGGTLQRTQLDGGSRQRQRTYRFTDVGAFHYTRWPATEAEQELPAARWTKTEQGMRKYPAAAVGKPVTEATALLWLAAAAPLDAAGDRIEVLTFSRRNVNRVIVEVTGTREVSVDFQEQGPTGTRRRRGRLDALSLRLHGAPLGAPAGDDEEFELLGLRGDLELLLDRETRAPLELRGRVKIAGQLTVRLRRATLR